MVFGKWRLCITLVVIGALCGCFCQTINWEDVVYVQRTYSPYGGYILFLDEDKKSLSENERYTAQLNFNPKKILNSLWIKQTEGGRVVLKSLYDGSYLGGEIPNRVEAPKGQLSFPGKDQLYINTEGDVRFGNYGFRYWTAKSFLNECVYITQNNSEGELLVMDADLVSQSNSGRVNKESIMFKEYDSERFNQVWLPLNEKISIEKNSRDNVLLFNLEKSKMMTLHSYSGEADQTTELDIMHDSYYNRFSFKSEGGKNSYAISSDKNGGKSWMALVNGEAVFGPKEKYAGPRQIFNLWKPSEIAKQAKKDAELKREKAKKLEEEGKGQEEKKKEEERKSNENKLFDSKFSLTGDEYRKFIDWSKVFRILYLSPDGRKLYLDANIGSSTKGCISFQPEKPISEPDQLFSMYTDSRGTGIESVYMAFVKKSRACILDSSDFYCLKFKEPDSFYSNHQQVSFENGVSIGGYNLLAGDIVDEEVVVKFDRVKGSNVKREDLVESMVYIMSGQYDYSVIEIGSNNSVMRRPYEKGNYGQIFVRHNGFRSVLTGSLIEDKELFLNSLLKEELVIKYSDADKNLLSFGSSKIGSVLTPEQRLGVDWRKVLRIGTIDPSSRFRLYLSSSNNSSDGGVTTKTGETKDLGVSNIESVKRNCGGRLKFTPLIRFDQTDHLWLRYKGYLVSVDDYYGPNHLLKALSSHDLEYLGLCELISEDENSLSEQNKDCVVKFGGYDNMFVGGKRLKRSKEEAGGYGVVYDGTDSLYSREQEYFFEVTDYLSDAFYVVTGIQPFSDSLRVYDVDEKGRLIIIDINLDSYTQLWKKDENGKFYNIIHGYVNVHNMLAQDRNLEIVRYTEMNQKLRNAPPHNRGRYYYGLEKNKVEGPKDDTARYDPVYNDTNEKNNYEVDGNRRGQRFDQRNGKPSGLDANNNYSGSEEASKGGLIPDYLEEAMKNGKVDYVLTDPELSTVKHID